MSDTAYVDTVETKWFEAKHPADGENAPAGVKRFLRACMSDKAVNPRNSGWGYVMDVAHEAEPDNPDELAEAVYGREYSGKDGDELAQELIAEEAERLFEVIQWFINLEENTEEGLYGLVADTFNHHLIDETFMGYSAEAKSLRAYAESQGLEADQYVADGWQIQQTLGLENHPESYGIDAIIPDGDDGWETIQVKPKNRSPSNDFDGEKVDTLVTYNPENGDVWAAPVKE